jgi:hypothetical protein
LVAASGVIIRRLLIRRSAATNERSFNSSNSSTRFDSTKKLRQMMKSVCVCVFA